MKKVACEFCGLELMPTASGVYVHVEGWAKNRKAGGTNQVSMPVRHPRYACKPCIDLRGVDLARDQMRLFE